MAVVRRWLLRTGLVLAGMIAALVVLAAATLRWGDKTLWPASASDPTVTIYVVSHEYHTGIVVPVAATSSIAGSAALPAVKTVATRFSAYPWLEIGWGDEGFYRQVPTVASLNIGIALRALFWPGNGSVVHVVGLVNGPRAMFPQDDIVSIDLSAIGFRRLLESIDRTFAHAANNRLPQEAGVGLYGPSLFYRATGTFSILHVCNHWVADLLDAAGVPTAPVLATVPAGLFLDLRWRSGLRPLPLHAQP